MSFCPNCGTQQTTGAKFCNNCGQAASNGNVVEQPAKNRVPTSNSSSNRTLDGESKKEALQLSNAFFSTFVIEFLLMKFQAEGSLKDIAGEDGSTILVIIFGMFALIIGATYFAVRIQGVNKGKSAWVLGTLLVFAALTGYSLVDNNFSNYNWADWASELVGAAQLFLLYVIYKIIYSATSEQG
jgi:hypothetical protein